MFAPKATGNPTRAAPWVRIDYEFPCGGVAIDRYRGHVWAVLTFFPIQGAQTQPYQNLFCGRVRGVFGFLFVTVAGRIMRVLGNSSNPISGMASQR